MQDTSASSLSDAQRCGYPSKPCPNPRVVKRNGELHRFCEFHRCRANFNQRRLEKRRQLEHDLQFATAPSDRTRMLKELEELKKYQKNSSSAPQPDGLELDDEDLQVVEEFIKQHGIELLLDFDEEDDRFIAENLAGAKP